MSSRTLPPSVPRGPVGAGARRPGSARWVAIVVAAAVVVVAWAQVLAGGAGVEERRQTVDGVPVVVLIPEGAAVGGLPAVVVVHGFAGSGVLMRTWADALTDAGFAVALPDLAGHGASTLALTRDDDGARLTEQVAVARDLLAEQPEVDGERIALLGHSMGSGAVLGAGITAPDRVAAVVAVSPTSAEVTSTLPPDLLLLAGEREPRFVANAEDLLERAGGAGGEPGTGTARDLRIVPAVEHVSILFSRAAHDEARAWITAAVGVPPADAPRDGPAVPAIAWWLAHLVAVLLLWRAVAPALVEVHVLDDVQRRRPLLGAVAGGLGATFGLGALGALVPLDAVGGMLVGPVLAAWFLLAGIVWLLVGVRPGVPGPRDLGWAGVLLGVLVLAFGVLAPRVWLPWWPSGPRLLAAPLFALLLVPWSLALATALQGRRGVRALGWWVWVSAVLVVTLGAAASVVTGLGFVVLLLPLLPALLGVAIAVVLPVQRPWAGGLATAGFLGWTMAILFPLA